MLWINQQNNQISLSLKKALQNSAFFNDCLKFESLNNDLLRGFMNKKILFTLMFMCSLQMQLYGAFKAQTITFEEKQEAAQVIGCGIGIMGGICCWKLVNYIPESIKNSFDKKLTRVDKFINRIVLFVAKTSKQSFRGTILVAPPVVLGGIGLEIGKRSVGK